MANKTISFHDKYPASQFSTLSILHDIVEVAATKGEECFHFVCGAVDVLKWQIEQGAEARDLRAALAHIWGNQGLGEE